jgi:hypothetical protein
MSLPPPVVKSESGPPTSLPTRPLAPKAQDEFPTASAETEAPALFPEG